MRDSWDSVLLVLREFDFNDSARESMETSISLMVGRALKFLAFFAGEERLSREMLESCPCFVMLPNGPFLRPVAGLEVRVELPLDERF